MWFARPQAGAASAGGSRREPLIETLLINTPTTDLDLDTLLYLYNALRMAELGQNPQNHCN